MSFGDRCFAKLQATHLVPKMQDRVMRGVGIVAKTERQVVPTHCQARSDDGRA